MDKATFAAGCFWCTDAVFQEIIGVEKVIPGYIDGHVKNPTYREVSSGTTGHAEAIEITFDPNVISFRELLEIFWTTHDPTTLNRQGKDIGSQYRSGIYTHSDDQCAIAVKSKEMLASEIWGDYIVTEIKEASPFYLAETYHQNYYKRNAHVGYCNAVIAPKIAKVRREFVNKIKAA